MASESDGFDFGALVEAIRRANEHLSVQASKAVNVCLTLRNWLIGLYIQDFELRGADRAAYGDNLLGKLSKELRIREVSNAGRRQLYNYLAFCRMYPQIMRTVPARSRHLIPDHIDRGKVPTASAQLAISPERLLNSFVHARMTLLSNTPSAGWTTNCLSPDTNSNYPAPRRSNTSCSTRSKHMSRCPRPPWARHVLPRRKRRTRKSLE